METKSERETNFCEIHKTKVVACSSSGCQKTRICKLCSLHSKEELQHMVDHYDNLKDFLIEKSEAAIKIKNEDIYAEVNKYVLEAARKKIGEIDNIFNCLQERRGIICEQITDCLDSKYQNLTSDFEQLVKVLTEKLGSISVSDSKVKEEIRKMKKDLDDKMTLFTDQKVFSIEFEKYLSKVVNNLMNKKVHDIIDGKFNYSSRFKALCLEWEGIDNKITVYPHGSSCWCIKSKEKLQGSFFCKIKILNIDASSVNSYWNYTCGICRPTIANEGTYYNDSLLLQSNGYIPQEFTGSGSHKSLFSDHWKVGDELLIKRDDKNDVYFGINSESSFTLAFYNKPGPYRIVMGFGGLLNGDIFEMEELRDEQLF